MHSGAKNAIILISLFIVPAFASADTVVLEGGRTIEGVVLNESSVEVTIRLETGAVVSFPRRRVVRIEKEGWEYYIQKGDEAPSPLEALEFYQKAREINPDAPGLEEKMSQARQRIQARAEAEQQAKLKQQRSAEEARIMQEYQTLMEGVRPQQARELLEEAIEAKPWLIEPRAKLADFLVRDRSPEARLQYVDVLAGLVRNDPENYYSLNVPPMVEAAKSLLNDPVASAQLTFEQKDRLIETAAPFTGRDGKPLTLSEFREAHAGTDSTTDQTLAKLEFMKNVCIERSEEQPTVGADASVFRTYARTLRDAGADAQLKNRVAEWTKEAETLVNAGQTARGAALGEVVLVFQPGSEEAKSAAIATRIEEARRQRTRGNFRQAEAALAAAEQINRDSPALAAEQVKLYTAIAESERRNGNLEAARTALSRAGMIQTDAAEAKEMLKQEKEQLAQTAIQVAGIQAGQQNYTGAIQAVELAKAVTPNFLESMKLNATLLNYRKQLVEKLAGQAIGAFFANDFQNVAAAIAQAKRFGVYDMEREGENNPSLKDFIDNQVVASMIKQAKEANQNEDYTRVFELLGRLEPIHSDAETQKMLQNARQRVVEGGGLTIDFFRGAWAGQGLLATFEDGTYQLRAGPINVPRTDLNLGQMDVQHRSGDQYAVVVDRSDGEDRIEFQVLSPDQLLIQRVQSTSDATPNQPTTITPGAVIKRVPQLPPGAEQGSSGGGGSSPPPTSSDLES